PAARKIANASVLPYGKCDITTPSLGKSIAITNNTVSPMRASVRRFGRFIVRILNRAAPPNKQVDTVCGSDEYKRYEARGKKGGVLSHCSCRGDSLRCSCLRHVPFDTNRASHRRCGRRHVCTSDSVAIARDR